MMDITIRGLSQQLNAEVAYLRFFLQEEKDIGFTNAAKSIELLAIELFKAANIANFIDANLIQVNYPAIDLHEPRSGGQGIAAQVTSTATAAKIKKTVRLFETARPGGALSTKYAKLYVLGLLKVAKKPSGTPAYCEVLGLNDLVKIIISQSTSNPAVMYDAISAVRSHIHRPVLLLPSGDIPALMVVLGFLDRSAIKHRMHREGSVADMVKGLREVKEVIYKGEVRGKSITKMWHEYADPNIREFLRQVGDAADQISGIVNGTTNSSASLTQAQEHEIDMLKQSIVQGTNAISSHLKLNFVMQII